MVTQNIEKSSFQYLTTSNFVSEALAKPEIGKLPN